MRTVEATGKTVDEAIYNGLVELGLSIDEVDIQVLEQGSKGLFGLGGTKVRVKLTEKERVSLVEEIFSGAGEEEPTKQKKAGGKPPVRNENPTIPKERPADGGGRREGGRDRNREGERRERQPRDRDRNRNRNRDNRERQPREQVSFAPVGEPIAPGPEAEFLMGLLGRMGMADTKVDCYMSDENCVYLTLSGPGMGVLIGRRGETLNALQYVVSLFANKGDKEYRRFIVDTENYRIKREQTLRKLAKRMAQEVRDSGKAMELEPMNPYERRVLHSELQNYQGITTHSEGEEPRRYVIIEPSTKA